MVRETRHLWVGNLPENIREDRIREHFKRYGRVQSVKLLPRGEECPVDGGSSGTLGEGNEGGSGSGSSGGGGSGNGGSSTSTGGASATVAFMDIKSAAKAHATEHTLDERALTTQYYEPQHLENYCYYCYDNNRDKNKFAPTEVPLLSAVNSPFSSLMERSIGE